MDSTTLSSRSSSAVNRGVGSLGGMKPPVLAGGQLVEHASSHAFLQRLPRLGRLTEPGQHGGQAVMRGSTACAHSAR